MVDPKNPLASPITRSLIQIGNIAAQWSHLEYKLAQTIWILLGLDEGTGKIVTGGLDMLPRVNMAINLSRHLKAPRSLIDLLVKVRKELQDKLQEERNRAIHGVHFHGSQGELLVEVHRGKGDRTRKPLPESDLNETGNRLHELGTELTAAVLAETHSLRLALLAMAKKMEATVSAELGPEPSGSNSQKA